MSESGKKQPLKLF